MTRTDTYTAIENIRHSMGDDLCIIGHHYQADDVIRHTDHRGDSLALARLVNTVPAKHIVFCGVYFMAESAALLARPDQSVYLPVPESECSMATMSPPDQVEAVLNRIIAAGHTVIPITYVNSTLAVKAVVGAAGGSVCTSSNAAQILAWALSKADSVLFVPDCNLGTNTAIKLGVPANKIHKLNTQLGVHSIDMNKVNTAQVLLWPGFCPIHQVFSVEHIDRVRAEYPGAKVIVHPECTHDVVKLADGAGSTDYLINYVADAAPGSTIVVGTELSLVQRLQKEYAGVKKVVPLADSICSHMSETTEESLLTALQDIQAGGKKYKAVAASDRATNARAALERMLRICS